MGSRPMSVRGAHHGAMLRPWTFSSGDLEGQDREGRRSRSTAYGARFASMAGWRR